MEFIHEFEVIVPDHNGHDDLGEVLCKCLAQTDPLPSQEGTEAHRVSLASTGGLGVGAGVVKPLRDEALWVLPLLRVVVETIDVNDAVVITSDCVLADLGWL